MENQPSDTRTALLQAAMVCFAGHGFDRTSMRMIAEKAGRPLSLLSHYFRNKEGLYSEVFKYLLSARNLPTPTIENVHDRASAIRLFREQIHLLYRRAAPVDKVAQTGWDIERKLWAQEFHSPRQSLHPILKEYIGPTVLVLKHCIHILRPELNESQVTFLGKSILGQVSGHGILDGFNSVVWGAPMPLGGQFQEAELLVDFCLKALQDVDLKNNITTNMTHVPSPPTAPEVSSEQK